jgi:hypothetical protein
MQTIPTSVTEPILTIARDEADNQSVRQQALSVLGDWITAPAFRRSSLSQQTASNWLAKDRCPRSPVPATRVHAYLRGGTLRISPTGADRRARALGQEYATAQDGFSAEHPTLERAHEAAALADIGGPRTRVDAHHGGERQRAALHAPTRWTPPVARRTDRGLVQAL